MRPGGRLAAAIEVLADIETRRRPAADALRDWGLSHRFAGSGDRAAIGNLVYDALRWRASSAWSMGNDSPRALALSAFRRGWVSDVAEINAAIEADAHAPDQLSDDEQVRLTNIAVDGLADAPDWVRGDYPEWLQAEFSGLFGNAASEEGAALSRRAPLDLRVNLLRASHEKAVKALARYSPQPVPLLPTGLRIPAGQGPQRLPNIAAEAAYQRGHVEIQDAASQLAAILSGATGAMQVGDVCTGGGGKALALAALMGNRGQIHAYDADRNRLAPIFDRIKRAGARNIQVHAPKAGLSEDLSGLIGKLDLVFVDAPCTGSGVWRRRPDAKWRLSPESLAKRQQEQDTILRAAAPLVKPGGRIVYATCSIMPAENDRRIETFLQDHSQFSILPVEDVVAATLGAADGPAFLESVHLCAHGLTMTPLKTGTDGFYVSALRRRG
ncbi:MAG: RsmB/NOP family class I SAM-dependent RNA methyltransferase [Pseudomonadota bacterium]